MNQLVRGVLLAGRQTYSDISREKAEDEQNPPHQSIE